MMDESNLVADAAETAQADWRTKDSAPMDGKWCWASDGERVWLVMAHKDGTLRSDGASAVKFWTRDFIPEPPHAPAQARR